MAKIAHANANPTKAFFVRMITRDISLEDCIFDLIDNSIDGAWQIEGSQPMSLDGGVRLDEYQIEIEAFSDRFRIVDNCGGITLDEAAEYAFTFGRKDDEKHESYSIGVYGIGMKRAVFKMGSRIKIRSTYRKDNGSNESFLVPISVDEWLQDDESKSWDFDIETAEDLDSAGVEVFVDKLNESTSNAFGDPGFVRRLGRTIARDYSLHLHRGLKIRLNGIELKGWQIELREGDEFAPMRIEYVDQVEDGEVSVEILAGMAAPPPESADPDEQSDDELRSGWYVVCNGRIVLAADRTRQTGWGTEGWPKWHPQYAGFLGLILFASENAKLLPITTTKRSIDASSEVFHRALPRMRDVSKEWTGYTNVRKQNLNEAKELEAQTKASSIFNVEMREAVVLPKIAAKPKVPMANILFSRPREKVRKLADEFGNINMSYRDVGIRAFDFAYAEHVGDD